MYMDWILSYGVARTRFVVGGPDVVEVLVTGTVMSALGLDVDLVLVDVLIAVKVRLALGVW